MVRVRRISELYDPRITSNLCAFSRNVGKRRSTARAGSECRLLGLLPQCPAGRAKVCNGQFPPNDGNLRLASWRLQQKAETG